MAAPSDPSDHFVSRAIRGDVASLKVLLAFHRASVRQCVESRISPRLRGAIDPDDIVQDAFVDVFRRISGFEWRGDQSFERWLLTIALRRLHDAIRRHASIKRGGGRVPLESRPPGLEDSMVVLLDLLAAPGQSPSQSVARHEAVNALHSALADLPEDYRRAVWMVHLEGQSIAATALAMKRTERAIENLCYKAKNRMREFLGNRSRFLSRSE